MKILITGGTGFVGTQLTARLIQDGHEVDHPHPVWQRIEGASPRDNLPAGRPHPKGPWQEAIKIHDAIINLAGGRPSSANGPRSL